MRRETGVSAAGLAYELTGSGRGPFAVLVHPLGTGARIFDDLAPRLAGRLSVLAYDLPGHGASPAPTGELSIARLSEDLAALLDELGIDEAGLCGVAFGGMVASDLALRHPERVGGLVLACTAPALGVPAEWHARAARARAGGLRELADAALECWLSADLRRDEPDLVAFARGLFLACDPEGYASCCEAIAAADQWSQLGTIAAPTLVLAGSADPVATPETALRHAAAITGAQLVVLPGAGHLAHLAAPERFASLVLDHLTGGTRAAGMAVRRAVLGDAHVERAGEVARRGAFGSAFEDLIASYAWGEIWTRPGLDRRTRSAITLAMLVCLGRHEELSFHLAAARRNGLSLEEIEEILLQSAIYAGVPAANSAFATARRALADELGG